MVDAYELERKFARYPRIVVSERIISKLKNKPPEHVVALLLDEDGRWHLNYMAAIVRHALSHGDFEGAMRWKRGHDDLIEEQIRQLESFQDGRAHKWRWFKRHLEIATSQFPAYLSDP